MAIGYVVACLWVLLSASEAIPDAIALVLHSAFNPVAAGGGFLGAGIALAIQTGIARGVFSNESGLGSAPIAAAAAKTKEPVEQGLVSMTGTFFRYHYHLHHDRLGAYSYRLSGMAIPPGQA